LRERTRFMRIVNAQVILRDAVMKKASVVIEGAGIKRVCKAAATTPKDPQAIDARGCYVSSGFIDSHIHGSPGEVLSSEVEGGTTAIVSAISCGSIDKIIRNIDLMKRFKRSSPLGPSLIGFRLEGPFINTVRAGAQNKKFITQPSPKTLKKLLKASGGLLKIVTLAPELKGSERLAKILNKNGVIASIGHTDADYKEAVKGINSGMTHATHLFNGMRHIAGKDPGAAFACLKDKRVKVEVIFDLIHVRPALLCMALAMKGSDDMILITDSVRAEMRRKSSGNGVYKLKNGTIAGSKLTMIAAVRNAVRFCGVSLKDAVAFATINPARLLGLGRHKGSIAKGRDADLVIFDKNFDVKMTIVRGKIAYQKRGF